MKIWTGMIGKWIYLKSIGKVVLVKLDSLLKETAAWVTGWVVMLVTKIENSERRVRFFWGREWDWFLSNFNKIEFLCSRDFLRIWALVFFCDSWNGIVIPREEPSQLSFCRETNKGWKVTKRAYFEGPEERPLKVSEVSPEGNPPFKIV